MVSDLDSLSPCPMDLAMVGTIARHPSTAVLGIPTDMEGAITQDITEGSTVDIPQLFTWPMKGCSPGPLAEEQGNREVP